MSKRRLRDLGLDILGLSPVVGSIVNRVPPPPPAPPPPPPIVNRLPPPPPPPPPIVNRLPPPPPPPPGGGIVNRVPPPPAPTQPLPSGLINQAGGPQNLPTLLDDSGAGILIPPGAGLMYPGIENVAMNPDGTLQLGPGYGTPDPTPVPTPTPDPSTSGGAPGTGTPDPGAGSFDPGAGGSFDDGSSDGSAMDTPIDSQALDDWRNYGIDPFDDGSDPGVADPSSDPTMDDGGDLDAAAAAPDDYADARAVLEDDDTVLGDYNPWALLYDPAGELYRNYTVHSDPGAFMASTGGPATWRGARTPSTDAQARLDAARARLASLQAQQASYYSQRAQGLMAPQQPAWTPPAPTPIVNPDVGTYDPTSGSGYTQDGQVDPFANDTVQGDVMDEYDYDDGDFAIKSEMQITDGEVDPQRYPASKHMGAAYLEHENYPLGGASTGRQGGSMRPEEKLEVFGKSNYMRGCDVLGATPVTPIAKLSPFKSATPPRAGFVLKKSPRLGRQFTSLVINKPRAHDHAASIKNARLVAARAAQTATRIANLKAPAKIPVAKAKAAVAVHGVDAVLGAARAVGHQVVTIAALKQEAKHLAADGKKLSKSADKHQKLVATRDARIKSGIKSAQAITHIHGDEIDMADVVEHADQMSALNDAMIDDLVVGMECEYVDTDIDDPIETFGHVEILGEHNEILGDASNPPDPNNPGYLMDGSPDPNYQGATGSPSDGSGVPGPPDYGLGPAPTSPPPLQPGVDYDPDPGVDTDFSFYSSDPNIGQAMGIPVNFVPLPVGAVFYDGTIKPAYMDLGSFTTFKGVLPAGKQPEGGPGSGYQWHDDGWWSFRSGDDPGPAGSGDLRLKHADDGSPGSMYGRVANSYNYNWGPLIGNPNTPGAWSRGLRYDVGGGRWFWFRDQAPAWATAADDAARLNQAILDYQTQLTAAKTDYVNQQLQDQLAAQQAADQARQQALADSQHQFQMDQDAKQAQADANTQALADQAAQAQAEAQNQLQIEQMNAQAQIDQQMEAQQFQEDMQAAQMAAQYAPPPPAVDDGSQYVADGSDDGSGLAAVDGGYGATATDDESVDGELPFGTLRRHMRRSRRG